MVGMRESCVLAGMVFAVALGVLSWLYREVPPRVVAEMKPHAWAEVHGHAGTVMSPIANVVINVTTVV